jgi:hypothetical protein
MGVRSLWDESLLSSWQMSYSKWRGKKLIVPLFLRLDKVLMLVLVIDPLLISNKKNGESIHLQREKLLQGADVTTLFSCFCRRHSFCYLSYSLERNFLFVIIFFLSFWRGWVFGFTRADTWIFWELRKENLPIKMFPKCYINNI